MSIMSCPRTTADHAVMWICTEMHRSAVPIRVRLRYVSRLRYVIRLRYVQAMCQFANCFD